MLGEGELIRETLDPGVRMGSMMSPLVAVDEEDRLVAVAGAAGGSRIRPALLQVLIRMLRGASPQEAIDAPRLNPLPGLVRVEPGFDPEVLAALAARSSVAVAERRDPYFGGVSALSPLGAGADPRRNGSVVLL
jgi:gamma-glutamyltranspeptidase/glutathione hydrolase